MRISKDHDGAVSGTVTGEFVTCGIDTSGLAHIMNVLSGLYAEPSAAVLREYCTNALDSHREAGNPDPIRVTLPSPLNPMLTIQDHGVGLSEDDILAVYATYGASSKRDSNDQVGAFGLGAKSAFTLGGQFTVTGIKDGRRTLAVFALNAEGAPTVSVQSRTSTDEPNGVTVHIAVNDTERVRAAAPSLFATWTPGTVLVDGEHPWSVYDHGRDLGHGIVVAEPGDDDTTGRNSHNLTIVMGNIGYPVSGDLAGSLYLSLPERLRRTFYEVIDHGQGVVYATVDIGDVDIIPSREGLKSTDRTMHRLRRVLEDLHDSIRDTAHHVVNAAPSFAAAAIALSRFQRDIPDREYRVQWSGHPIEPVLDLPYPSSRYLPERDKFEHERYAPSRLWLRHDLNAVLVVTSVPDGKLDTAIRHAKTFHKHTGDRTVRHLVFSQAAHGAHEWFEFGTQQGFRTITFDDYLSRGKQPTGSRAARETVRYQVHKAHGEQHHTAAEMASWGLPVLTFTGENELHDGPLAEPEFRAAVLSGTTPVVLTHGRTSAALARRVGSSVEVRRGPEEAERVAVQVLSEATEGDRDCYRAQFHTRNQGVHAGMARQALLEAGDRITNPRARAILDAMKRAPELTDAEKRRQKLLNAAALAAPEQAQATLPALTSLTSEFPLLWGCRVYDMEHVITYINALA